MSARLESGGHLTGPLIGLADLIIGIVCRGVYERTFGLGGIVPLLTFDVNLR